MFHEGVLLGSDSPPTNHSQDAIASVRRFMLFGAFMGAVGNAIGGLSVGEPAEEMYAMTEVVTAILPEDKPRYLMGVGYPVDLALGVALGVDMFDCVYPTRTARFGTAFSKYGNLRLKNENLDILRLNSAFKKR